MTDTKIQKYATFKQRFFAGIIDFFILLPMVILEGGLVWENGHPNMTNQFEYLITFVLSIIYTVVMEVEYQGQTIGRRIMKIQLKMEDGSRLTYGKALVRIIVSYTSAAVLLLGYISFLWNKKKQTWHDRVAQTIVVQK